MYDSFGAFRPHFNALARAGYFKIVLRPEVKWKNRFHYYYRLLVWIAILSYNLQHVIQAIQVRHHTKQLVGTLFILLTTLNALGKQLAFNVRVRRIDNLIKTINGSLFAPKNPYHEKLMTSNATSMSRLLTVYHISIYICGVLFTVYPLIDKALGNDVYLTGYFPFNTTTSPAFELAAAYTGILITIQGYGHVTLDCTIVAFYCYVKVQLQIFRYNLEHLLDEFKLTKINLNYVDEDEDLKKKINETFENYVKHYRKIVWFAREIESIFSEAMVVQFFMMAWVICMTVYKIVGLPLFTAEFISMATYLGCMLAQLFIYCYFGTHIKDESEYVNDSIYQSEWLSLSPAYRRRLIILMERCKRPIEIRTAVVVPMSLDTYISVLRSSYALFTILDSK